MAAICYIRVSTAEQAKQQYNLPTQEKKVRDHCQTEGWPVLQLFTDKESARTAEDRPAFQKMLDYCRKNKGKVTHVVVADLSRFARNLFDQGKAIAGLQQLGIKVVSVDEPITDDTAAGKLARNMLGAMNQFFSDSLSERIRFRMQAGLKEGRFLHYAPIGYTNVNKNLVVDPERGPLVRQAFELLATGNYSSTDSVLKLVTSLGLRTRRGRVLTKQSWGRLLSNPIYAGWIVSRQDRVRGKHEALISDATFQKVQERIGGKSTPHKQINDDFPLRGLVRCSSCGKYLTAGWARGRKDNYPRYWCWKPGCRKVGVGRDELEAQFLALLNLMEPTAELIAMLPMIAAREWETRKARIAKDAEQLSKRLADQTTLNQRTIRAKIEGEISAEEFQTMKDAIAAETGRIREQINALDSERSAMQDLIEQAQVQSLDLVAAWRNGSTAQKQELVRGFFPEGLPFSNEKKFFEPRNPELRDMQLRWLQANLIDGTPEKNIGAGDGI